tara:strand:+ start:607 stop:1527 length:921 start_codon:yes stop_codon:yes gene_type:complete
MGLISIVKRSGASGYGSSTTAEQVTDGLDLRDKTYIVTGCNSGLGKETVRVLALRGASVFALSRTFDKAQRVADEISGLIFPIECDLSEPRSIRSAISCIRKENVEIDGLIANAGIMALPKLNTKYNLELQFLTNHVGHFILVTELLNNLKEQGRIVMVSSAAHEMVRSNGINFDNLSGDYGYSPFGSYGQSKLCNLLFARHLATRLKNSGRTSNAVHPGVILTPLIKNVSPIMRIAGNIVSPIFMKNVEQGAATQVYVATNPNLNNTTGNYFADCNIKRPSPLGSDVALATELWDRTETIVESLP